MKTNLRLFLTKFYTEVINQKSMSVREEPQQKEPLIMQIKLYN